MIREERNQGRSKTGSLYLLTGVVIGVVIGLIFSLVIAPLRYKDATPDILDKSSQDMYKILIAQAYDVEKDMGRVLARWATFGVGDVMIDANSLMIILSSTDGRSDAVIALDYLLLDMRKSGTNPEEEQPADAQPTATPEDTSQELSATAVAQVEPVSEDEDGKPAEIETSNEEESALPEETQPPIPTSTVVAALSKPFQLEERLVLCEEDFPRLLQIQVKDDDGTALQGVAILLSWSSGSEVFYTGLFPALDDGYADYEMDENETYRIQVGQSGVIVDGLGVNTCEREDGSTYVGGWWLSFQP